MANFSDIFAGAAGSGGSNFTYVAAGVDVAASSFEEIHASADLTITLPPPIVDGQVKVVSGANVVTVNTLPAPIPFQTIDVNSLTSMTYANLDGGNNLTFNFSLANFGFANTIVNELSSGGVITLNDDAGAVWEFSLVNPAEPSFFWSQDFTSFPPFTWTTRADGAGWNITKDGVDQVGSFAGFTSFANNADWVIDNPPALLPAALVADSFRVTGVSEFISDGTNWIEKKTLDAESELLSVTFNLGGVSQPKNVRMSRNGKNVTINIPSMFFGGGSGHAGGNIFSSTSMPVQYRPAVASTTNLGVYQNGVIHPTNSATITVDTNGQISIRPDFTTVTTFVAAQHAGPVMSSFISYSQ